MFKFNERKWWPVDERLLPRLNGTKWCAYIRRIPLLHGKRWALVLVVRQPKDDKNASPATV